VDAEFFDTMNEWIDPPKVVCYIVLDFLLIMVWSSKAKWLATKGAGHCAIPNPILRRGVAPTH